MSSFRSAAFVAVLLAVAAVQPSQADEAAIKDMLVAQTKAFVNKHVPHGNVAAEAVRGRSLAQKSGICGIMETSLTCSKKAQADCTGTCAWSSGACDLSDATAMTGVMQSGALNLVAPVLQCQLDTDCTNTNCTKGDTCAPTAAAVNAALPNDKVLAKIMAGQYACGIWTSADTCGKATSCSFDAKEKSCDMSDSAGENLAPMLIKECGLTVPSSAATSSIAAMAIVVVLGTLFVM